MFSDIIQFVFERRYYAGFDFSAVSDSKEPSVCTYTTFSSDAPQATDEYPILLLERGNREFKHHSTGMFTNPVKRTTFEFDDDSGVLSADIIKVDEKYETAIETALGGNIQNIVTDNESTAKKMIGFLKKNRLGRATFLPLTSLTNPQEFKAAGVISLAIFYYVGDISIA